MCWSWPDSFVCLSTLSIANCLRFLLHVVGVELDNTIYMVKQASSVTKNYFFQLNRMHNTQECMIKDTGTTMVDPLVTSKLDYYNSLLYGLLYVLLKNVVENAEIELTDRLITTEKHHGCSFGNNTSIQYKVLCLTYKGLNAMEGALDLFWYIEWQFVCLLKT